MQRILVPGSNGQVGRELQSALETLGTVIPLDRSGMDLASADSIRNAVRDAMPSVIINAAAYNHVDRAESEPELAMQVNGVAPGIMAEEAKHLGAILVHYSTDYVFDGERNHPYVEEAPPNPLNTYGRSKLAGERAVEAVGGRFLILRSSWIYSARRSNFVLTVLRLAHEKRELSMVNDQCGSPTWARWIAQATAALLRKRDVVARLGGTYHLAATGYATRYEFAEAIVDTMKKISGNSLSWAKLKPITTDQYPLPARRPLRPVMRMDKVTQALGVAPPPWQEQLHDFLKELVKSTRLGV